MKTWQQILIEADAFVKFLSQDSLYAKPYNGGLPEEFVLTDATIGRLVASGGFTQGFEDWESLTDSINTFPEDFEWNRSVKSKLQKNKYFDIEMTRWAAADEVWIAVLEKYPNLSRIVALNRTISLPILIRLSKSNDWLTRCDVAMKRRITPSMFHALSRDPEPAVRKRIALNPKAPLDVLQMLADDQDKTVSDAAKERLESR